MKKIFLRSLLIAIVLVLQVFSFVSDLSAQQKIEGASSRSWTGPIFGGASIQATPIEYNGQDLKLRTDGGEMSVPLSRLSEEDQKYVRELLKNPPKKAARGADFGKGTVNIQKFMAHLPKASPVKTINWDGGTNWNFWVFCVSRTTDEKTLVLSRFTDKKWLSSYNRDTETYGPVFEMPTNDNAGVVYHVISTKDPDKCYAAFGSKEICEYSISTGRILRRINCKGYPDRIALNKNCDKLYIAGTPMVWDLKTNRVTQLADYDGDCIALNSTERQVAVGVHDKGTVMIYNTNSRKPPQSIKAMGKHVSALRFVDNDKYLLVGTATPATVSLYGLSTGKPLFTIGGFDAGKIGDVFCNSDQSLLFVVQSRSPWEGAPTIVFDTQTMLPVCQFPASYHVENAILSSDEKQLLVPSCWVCRFYEVPDRETIDATLVQMKELDR